MSKNYFGKVELVEEEQIADANPVKIVGLNEGDVMVTTTIAELSVLVGGGGETPNLEEVLTEGNSTTQDINGTNYALTNDGVIGNGGELKLTNGIGATTYVDSLGVNQGGFQNYWPDNNGVIATQQDIEDAIAEIPAITIDNTPTPGSTNAVSSGGVAGALTAKEDASNKQNSLAVDGTGNKYTTVDAVNGGLATKQDVLVSGTNIKTINGNTVLGSGNLVIAAGAGTVTSVTGVSGEITVANGTTTPVVGIDPAYTAARTSYVDSRTLDNVPDTATRKAVQVGATPFTTFTTANIGETKYVSSPFITPGTNNSLQSPKGIYANSGVLNVPITLEDRFNVTLAGYGDSFMAGFGLANSQDWWINKIGAKHGWTVSNGGTSGARVIDKYKGLYVSSGQEIAIVGLGINDIRQYGITSIPAYTNFMMGYLLSLNNAGVVNGQGWTKTTPADWSNDNLFFNTATASKTTVNNSPATFTTTGDVVYVNVAYQTAGSCAYTITIDGNLMGTFNAASSQLVGYPVPPAGSADTDYYPFTHRFVVAKGLHTVVIQKTSGTTALRLIGGSSNSVIKPAYGNTAANIYVIGLAHMGTAAYAAYAGNIAGLNDATIDAANLSLNSLVTTLAKDGIKIKFLDATAYFEPNKPGNTQADVFHPSAQGGGDYVKLVDDGMAINNLAERQIAVNPIWFADKSGNAVLNGNVGTNTETIFGGTGRKWWLNSDITNSAFLELTNNGTNFLLRSGRTGGATFQGLLMNGGASNGLGGFDVTTFTATNTLNKSLVGMVVYGGANGSGNSSSLQVLPNYTLSAAVTTHGIEVFPNYSGASSAPQYIFEGGSKSTTADGAPKTITSNIDVNGNAVFNGTVKVANAVANNDAVNLGQMNNRAVTMVSAAYTILPLDYYIELTTGTFTITLPTAVGVTGKEYVIKNGNTGVMTLATTGGQTIDGSTTKTYNSQYAGVRVISNGANWRVNGSF